MHLVSKKQQAFLNMRSPSYNTKTIKQLPLFPHLIKINQGLVKLYVFRANLYNLTQKLF